MADAKKIVMSEDDVWSVLFELQEKVQDPETKLPLEYDFPPSFSFLSDNIFARNVKGKGRGYFAKADLQPGTLLLVERPMVHVYDSGVIGSHSEVFGATTAMLTLKLLQLISDSPELLKEVSGLHPQKSDFNAKKHEVEIESESLKKSLEAALEACDDLIIPPELRRRLTAIVRYNQIGFYTNNEQLCFQSHYRQTSGTGLYVKASLFNHGCRPNVVYYTIDNVLLVHVSRKVKANEELCFSYMESSSLADSALFRNVHLDRDFICGCALCKDELREYDIKLIQDPNAVDPRMCEVLSEGIMSELWKMDAFERMTFAAEIKSAEDKNFKKKDHIEYSMLMAISYEQCVLWEKSLWFWEASISACCGVDDHDELVKYLHASLAALALGNQKRFRQHLQSFLQKHDAYCGGGFRNLQMRYKTEIQLHPVGPRLKQLFWKFSEKLFPKRI